MPNDAEINFNVSVSLSASYSNYGAVNLSVTGHVKGELTPKTTAQILNRLEEMRDAIRRDIEGS